MNRCCSEHARCRGAVLTGVEISGHRDGLRGRCDVGIIEDDDRRLAAKLEVHTLEVAGSRTRDLHTGAHAAGDRRHRRDPVGHERRAGAGIAADNVEDARWQELGHDLGHQQRGHRRGVRRLEHDGIARGDRGRPLPDRHHHRVVPGRDLGADADRFATDHRRVPGHVLAGAPALEDARASGEEAHRVDQLRDLLAARQRDRLAGVLALECDEFLGALLECVGDAQEREAALSRRRVTPAAERPLRGLERRVHIGGAGDRRASKLLARGGVDQRREGIGARVAVVAVDEVAQGAHRDRAHALRSRASSRKLST